MADSSSVRVLNERRARIRFPLQLAANCAFHKKTAPVTIRCRGQIQNLSARGCSLIVNQPEFIDVGMNALLWIDWPAKLHGKIAVQFLVAGRVLRVQGDQVAIVIRSHDFRINGRGRTTVI